MSKVLALSRVDIRNIFRDQILYILFVVAPISQFLIARFLIPVLGSKFPEIQPYYSLILLAIILQITSGIGFVIASIILDERDEDVLTALRVVPISTNLFLSYRLLFAVAVSFIFSWLMFRFSGLISLTYLQGLGLSILFSMIAPIILMALTIFSANKVEGLAIFKALNFLLFLPIIGLFVPGLKWLFIFIPSHWTFQYLVSLEQGQIGIGNFTIAVAVHLIYILVFIQLFKKKVF